MLMLPEERGELMQRTKNLAWNLARRNNYQFPSRSLMERWNDQLMDNNIIALPLEIFGETLVNDSNEIEVLLELSFSTICNYWCSGHRCFPDLDQHREPDHSHTDDDYVLRLITSHPIGFPSDTNKYKTYRLRLDNVFKSEDDNADQIMLRIRKQLLQDIDQIYNHESAGAVLSNCEVMEKVMKSISDTICSETEMIFHVKPKLLCVSVLIDSLEHKFFESVEDVDSVIASTGNPNNPHFINFLQDWRNSTNRCSACLFFEQQRNRRDAAATIW